jgi:hypothetical protein
MTAEEKIVESTLIELTQLMRQVINKKYKDRIYYEFRIKQEKLKEFKVVLFKLYFEGFRQGVYTAK